MTEREIVKSKEVDILTTEVKYDLNIGHTLSEAWRNVKGVKLPFWVGFIIFIALVTLTNYLFMTADILTSGIVEYDKWGDYQYQSGVLGVLNSLVTLYLSGYLFVSLILHNYYHIKHKQIGVKGMFSYFKRTGWTFLGSLLLLIIIILGIVALIIPGVFLAVAAFFTLPLIAEKNLSPWVAFKTSLRYVKHHWFKVFFLLIITFIIGFIAAFIFGLFVGLFQGFGPLALIISPLLLINFWVVPWIYNIYAMMYIQVFKQ